MMKRILPQSVTAIAMITAANSASAVTLEYDPAESANYAIADITLSLTAFGGTNDATGDFALLTDDDLNTGISFGRFLDPGLLDVAVDLNNPATTDRFRLTSFTVVVAIDGVALDPASPVLQFTDADGVPQALSTTSTAAGFGFEVDADIAPTGNLLDAGTTLTLSGIDLPFTEPEARIVEVIIEGVGEPIPEPTSLALLGLGGLIVSRRRR